MDTKKTLRYNWEFGRETVAIHEFLLIGTMGIYM